MLIATSWDDGLESDRRLLDILARHGVRASFALSPSRHRSAPVPNDARNAAAYGMLLPRSELTIYRDHDICSHTAEHREQTLLGEMQVRQDLYNGKAQLEELFDRPVTGLVWPYGCSNRAVIRIARQLGYQYGRTTPAPERRWLYQAWDIVPWSWRTPLADLLNYNFRCLALSGHTYELRTQADWEAVERFYRDAAQDPRCTLVTLTELAQSL